MDCGGRGYRRAAYRSSLEGAAEREVQAQRTIRRGGEIEPQHRLVVIDAQTAARARVEIEAIALS